MPSDRSTGNALLTDLVVVGRLACTAVCTGLLQTLAVASVPVAVGAAALAAACSLADTPGSDLAVALALSGVWTLEPEGCTMSDLLPADLSAAMLALPIEMETAEPDVGMSASAEPAGAAAVGVGVGSGFSTFWAAGLRLQLLLLWKLAEQLPCSQLPAPLSMPEVKSCQASLPAW